MTIQRTHLDKGYIQIYTGNGKGKTTAAIGQAIRAAGNGYRSLIIQFMKEYPYSELTALKQFKEFIEIEQYCGDDFVYKNELPSKEEKDKAVKAIKRAEEEFTKDYYDIIILDEIVVSIYFKLIEVEAVIELIKKKPTNKELILTGRYCPKELIDLADLVTEMKEVKHYYQKGITSRKGFES
ncbi:MAG: cob(I)yrinic acid a,c-diamide adenosyltransferase [Melioribacteraceae bacterium]|nr:cob(I)yrinic acid a,c-diamide adenosyltransferase [Melioribacteraceae bacterium]